MTRTRMEMKHSHHQTYLDCNFRLGNTKHEMTWWCVTKSATLVVLVPLYYHMDIYELQWRNTYTGGNGCGYCVCSCDRDTLQLVDLYHTNLDGMVTGVMNNTFQLNWQRHHKCTHSLLWTLRQRVLIPQVAFTVHVGDDWVCIQHLLHCYHMFIKWQHF